MASPRRLRFVTRPRVLKFDELAEVPVALACVPFIPPGAITDYATADASRFEGDYADGIRAVNDGVIGDAREAVGPLLGDGRVVGDLLYGLETGRPSGAPGYLDFGDTPPVVLGQFRHTYILAEERSELLLVDQHAAEERVLFNGLMESSAAPRTLGLLQPVPLDLSPTERTTLLAEGERLGAVGFQIESFGSDAWILRGVPELLGVGRGLDVLMCSLGSEESECSRSAAHDARARIMARVACHAAVTANVRLGRDRMRELLRQLWLTSNPSTCPHGRPTVLRLDLPFIERRFGRR